MAGSSCFFIFNLSYDSFQKCMKMIMRKKKNEDPYVNDFLSTLYISAKASGTKLVNYVYLFSFSSYHIIDIERLNNNTFGRVFI